MNGPGKKWLYIGWGVFALFFFLSRIPSFLYYPSVFFNPDYPGYYMIVDQIHKGFWPLFTIRTPGFPFFLMLVSLVSSKNIAVIIAQNLISLAVPLFFVYVAYRIAGPRRRWAAPISAVLLGAFVSSAIHVSMDATLMTDSLAMNCLLLVFALLTLGLYQRSRRTLLWTSIAMGFLILIRPSGIFLAAVYALTLLFLFARRRGYPKRTLPTFAVPFASILVLMAGYNALTIRTFALSTFNEHAMISYAATFLEPDPAFPESTNKLIEETRGWMTPEEHATLRDSWNLNKINDIFVKYFNWHRVKIALAMLGQEDPNEYNLYLKWRPLWKKMIMVAIRKHPDIVLKFFIANLKIYASLNAFDIDYNSILVHSRREIVAEVESMAGSGDPQANYNRRFNPRAYALTLNEGFIKGLLKEYYPIHRLHVERPNKSAPAGGFVLKDSFWQRLSDGYHEVIVFVFRNMLWVFLFAAAAVYGLVRGFQTRFRHRGAFLYILMAMSVLLNAAIVCLSSLPVIRHSYPLEFVVYLAPLFVLLMIKPDDADAPAEPVVNPAA